MKIQDSSEASKNEQKALISTINKLVEENLRLQKEVERVQDEMKGALTQKLSILDTYINPENAPEEQKLPFNPEISGEDTRSSRYPGGVNMVGANILQDPKKDSSGNLKKSVKSIVIHSSSSSGSDSSGNSSSESSEEQVIVITRKIQSDYTGSFLEEIESLKKQITGMSTEKDNFQKEITYLQEKCDKQDHALQELEIQNSALLQALQNREKAEASSLIDKADKGCQVQIREEPIPDARFYECRAIIDRYQAVYEDLQTSYTLPEELVQECEVLQEKYQDLLVCAEASIPRESSLEEFQDGKVETLESYDEPIPLKDSSLEISHIKHKNKIPVLDLTKVQVLSSSEEEEDVAPQPKQPIKSVSSSSDGDNVIKIFKNEDCNENYLVFPEEVKNLDNSFEEPPAEVNPTREFHSIDTNEMPVPDTSSDHVPAESLENDFQEENDAI